MTSYGESQIARTQFDKGCAFIGAALLLKPHAQNESYKYVYLHLVCQGIELILKGLLLTKNYKIYRPKERTFGHNILAISEAATREFDLNPLKTEMISHLKYVSEKFSQHQLRYSSIHDIFINPDSINIDLVMRRLGASVRLAKRHLDRI